MEKRFLNFHPSDDRPFNLRLFDLKRLCYTIPAEDSSYIHSFRFKNFPLIANTYFSNNHLSGLYHPYFGTVLPAVYDRIIEVDSYNCAEYGMNEKDAANYLILVKGKQQKRWKVPGKHRAGAYPKFEKEN